MSSLQSDKQGVVILDGDFYTQTLSFYQTDEDFFPHQKIVLEIERLINVPLKKIFTYYSGSQKNKVEKCLCSVFSESNNVQCIFECVTPNDILNDAIDPLSPFKISIAVSTKLFECAFGVNGESIADRIVLITGDDSLLKAVQSAEGKQTNKVHVVTTCPSVFTKHLLSDKSTNSSVYLPDIVRLVAEAESVDRKKRKLIPQKVIEDPTLYKSQRKDNSDHCSPSSLRLLTDSLSVDIDSRLVERISYLKQQRKTQGIHFYLCDLL
jgi:hypothetical protein